MSVQPIPDGFHSLTPVLCVDNAVKAVQFYTRAFGAVEIMPPMLCPQSGKVMHTELKIGDSIFFLCDEIEQMNIRSAKTIGDSPQSLFMYVDDVDEQFRIAAKAGAQTISEPADMFWGDRCGVLVDPFGHRWTLATHKEDVTPEEMMQRMQNMGAQAT